MAIFKINNNLNLAPIKEKTISLEKNLQKITEDNLNTIFGLEFISTEFSLQQFRIDTLAFDREVNAFVIIEYKKTKSFSVIDQGYSYLALMLNNKADFILEYNEKTKKNLKREEVDWSQSRVIFLSNSFTTYQQNAINFKDLPIELWEVKKYDNETILYNQLRATESKESIKTISKDKTLENVNREVKKYSVEDHFKSGWDDSRDLFDALREKVFELDSQIEEHATKFYIGYKIGNSVVFAITPRKSKLRIELNRVRPEDVKDVEGKLSYVENSMKFYNKHVSEFFIDNETEVEYALFLIKQVYQKFHE